MTAIAPPVIDLSAGSGTTYHTVDLSFSVKQDDQPFFDMALKYSHCNDAIVAVIQGHAVDMAASLGPKGKKPKEGEFDILMSLKVDNVEIAKADWQELSRKTAMGFERHVLNIWLHMNEQATLAGKAKGTVD